MGNPGESGNVIKVHDSVFCEWAGDVGCIAVSGFPADFLILWWDRRGTET